MSQFVETPCKTFRANAAIGQYLRVKLSSGELVLAGSTDAELGTMERAALAADEYVAVRLRTAQGTCKMVASDTFAANDPVYSGSNGLAAPSGTVLIGHALEAATAAGDIVEVLRIGQASAMTEDAGGTTAAAFEVDSDASTPKIALSGQSGGTGDFTTTLKPESTLSADNAIIVPEADGDVLAAVALAQTLTNKTLTAPVINGAKTTLTVEAHTSNDTLGAAETGTVHTTTGASGAVTFTLPEAAVGLEYYFYVGAAQELRIDPDGNETISLPSTGVPGAAGKYLTANAAGESVHIMCCVAGSWAVMGFTGTWTAEP